MPYPVLAADTDGLHSLQGLHAEALLLPLLWQLAIIVLAARLFGAAFRKIGQPAVVGEIAAGIVLGPSVFGCFFHDAFQAVFHPVTSAADPYVFSAVLNWIVAVLAQLGLVFFLFLIGLEFDFSHLRRQGKTALAISWTGVAVPFVLGLLIALIAHSSLEPHPLSDGSVDKLGFALFLGTALAITAIPVLGRILLELGLTRTELGTIAITAAAADDAAGWIMLAAVAAIARGEFQVLPALGMILLTVAFVVVMLLLRRPIKRFFASFSNDGANLTPAVLALLIASLFVCAIVTNLIGIFAVFGAFLFGAVLSGNERFREAVNARLRDFVTVFFLPVYFTYTGLRTEIGTLDSWYLWLIFAAVLTAAIVGKLGGCGLAAWFNGRSPREAACMGVLMNTRGLMELIVVNVGYELRVIPKSVYCMLVLTALITTFMTTPILLRLMKGTKLEQERAAPATHP